MFLINQSKSKSDKKAMVLYRDLISRADTGWLQEQVGDMSVRVMQAFDEKGINAQSLRQVLLSLVSPYDLIANPAKRNSLFDFLRKDCDC